MGIDDIVGIVGIVDIVDIEGIMGIVGIEGIVDIVGIVAIVDIVGIVGIVGAPHPSVLTSNRDRHAIACYIPGYSSTHSCRYYSTVLIGHYPRHSPAPTAAIWTSGNW